MKKTNEANFIRQSYAGVIRQRLAHIERSISYGAKQELIRKELELEGFKADPGTFRKSLWRARRWWRYQIQLHIAASKSKKMDNEKSQEKLRNPTYQAGPGRSETGFSNQPVQHLPKNNQRDPTTSTARINRPELDKFFKRKSIFSPK